MAFAPLSLTEKLDPKRTAIVVVDVQNDFCHPDGYSRRRSGNPTASPQHQSMRTNIARLLEASRHSGALLVFVRILNDPKYLSAPAAERLEKIGFLGKCLLEGTWGADYWEEIRPQADNPREIEVIKHRYSAFWGTNLDQLLRSHGIQTTVFTGLATSGCVESSARDAFFCDYYVMLAADACADDEESHRNTLRKFERSFGEVLNAEQIVQLWAGSASASHSQTGTASGRAGSASGS